MIIKCVREGDKVFRLLTWAECGRAIHPHLAEIEDK